MTGYTVLIDDNFDFYDSSKRVEYGQFDSYADAVAACKAMVDRYLSKTYRDGMTAEQLNKTYKSFGPDPFTQPAGEERFSAWDYAKERCQDICVAAA